VIIKIKNDFIVTYIYNKTLLTSITRLCLHLQQDFAYIMALCYVEEHSNSYAHDDDDNSVTLYWTDCDINWPHLGDDWNNVPYEHNASEPYNCVDSVTIDLPFGITFPRNHNGECLNSEYSVDMINQGTTPWLMFENYTLYAGTNMSEFSDFLINITSLQEVVTIQRCFRGFLGRRIATELRYRPDAIGFEEAKEEFERLA